MIRGLRGSCYSSVLPVWLWHRRPGCTRCSDAVRQSYVANTGIVVLRSYNVGAEAAGNCIIALSAFRLWAAKQPDWNFSGFCLSMCWDPCAGFDPCSKHWGRPLQLVLWVNSVRAAWLNHSSCCCLVSWFSHNTVCTQAPRFTYLDPRQPQFRLYRRHWLWKPWRFCASRRDGKFGLSPSASWSFCLVVPAREPWRQLVTSYQSWSKLLARGSNGDYIRIPTVGHPGAL